MNALNVLFDWPPAEGAWITSIFGWFKRYSSWILIGLFAQVLTGIGISAAGVSSDVELARRFDKPILAFELAASSTESEQVLGDKLQNLEPMRKQFYLDFPFIASYSLTFVLLGLALFSKGRGWSKVNIAAASVILCGLTAGVMDVFENIHGLNALAHAPLLASAVEKMRFASLVKWSALGLICIPAAYAFWPAQGWTLFRIVSKVSSFLLVAAACVFAVGEIKPEWEHFWEFASACMAVSAAFQIILLVLWPIEFERSMVRKRT